MLYVAKAKEKWRCPKGNEHCTANLAFQKLGDDHISVTSEDGTLSTAGYQELIDARLYLLVLLESIEMHHKIFCPAYAEARKHPRQIMEQTEATWNGLRAFMHAANSFQARVLEKGLEERNSDHFEVEFNHTHAHQIDMIKEKLGLKYQRWKPPTEKTRR